MYCKKNYKFVVTTSKSLGINMLFLLYMTKNFKPIFLMMLVSKSSALILVVVFLFINKKIAQNERFTLIL